MYYYGGLQCLCGGIAGLSARTGEMDSVSRAVFQTVLGIIMYSLEREWHIAGAGVNICDCGEY